MIGRAAIGNPWIFGECKSFDKEIMPVHQPTLSQRTSVCRRHLILAAEAKGEVKAIREMRKHYSGYFKHIPHFKNYRMKLVTAVSLDDLFKIFDEIQNIQ
jgi:tRNA-dihydrouridine synthase